MSKDYAEYYESISDVFKTKIPDASTVYTVMITDHGAMSFLGLYLFSLASAGNIDIGPFNTSCPPSKLAFKIFNTSFRINKIPTHMLWADFHKDCHQITTLTDSLGNTVVDKNNNPRYFTTSPSGNLHGCPLGAILALNGNNVELSYVNTGSYEDAEIAIEEHALNINTITQPSIPKSRIQNLEATLTSLEWREVIGIDENSPMLNQNINISSLVRIMALYGLFEALNTIDICADGVPGPISKLATTSPTDKDIKKMLSYFEISKLFIEKLSKQKAWFLPTFPILKTAAEIYCTRDKSKQDKKAVRDYFVLEFHMGKILKCAYCLTQNPKNYFIKNLLNKHLDEIKSLSKKYPEYGNFEAFEKVFNAHLKASQDAYRELKPLEKLKIKWTQWLIDSFFKNLI